MNFEHPDLIENPYPHYEKWRSERPIWRAEDINAWVLSRYEDVRTVLKDAKRFSSQSMGEMEHQVIALPLLTDDPPRHTQLRSIVSTAFTSRTLKQMEEEIEKLVEDLLNELDDSSTIDIAANFTIPLPVSLISRLMGIPEERGEDFKRWSDALVSTGEASEVKDRMPDIMEMAGFFQTLIQERKENPGDDLISKVVSANVKDLTMNDQDMVGFCMLLLIAGNETTANLLSNLLLFLSNNHEIWDELRDDPGKIEAAVEEALRFEAPVQWTNRKATEDVEFHGRTIKAGDAVYVMMGSANRDPQRYDNPDEFRLDRGGNDHHSLGYGIHFCIGAPLARMEARYALQGLLRRYKRINPVEGADNERTYSNMLRGFHHLWLEFEKA